MNFCVILPILFSRLTTNESTMGSGCSRSEIIQSFQIITVQYLVRPHLQCRYSDPSIDLCMLQNAAHCIDQALRQQHDMSTLEFAQ